MPQRYFIDKNIGIISGQDAHHIKQVMRMRTNDIIIVCAEGECFEASITILKDDVHYQMIKSIEKPHTLDITLVQGMPKGSKIETTLKYATMFGVSHIHLVDMIRSIRVGNVSETKEKRYQMIMKEASELAHRFFIPHLSFNETLKDIKWNEFDLILLADENEKTVTLKDAIPEHLRNQKIALIIGPEGGIDEKERLYLKQQHAIFISLGSHILSSEIACLYALSVLNALNT